MGHQIGGGRVTMLGGPELNTSRTRYFVYRGCSSPRSAFAEGWDHAQGSGHFDCRDEPFRSHERNSHLPSGRI